MIKKNFTFLQRSQKYNILHKLILMRVCAQLEVYAHSLSFLLPSYSVVSGQANNLHPLCYIYNSANIQPSLGDFRAG